MKIVLVGCVVLGAVIGSVAAERPRVYVSDSKSWEISGGTGGADGALGATGGGGDRPQTAEIIKTFGERCPDVVVNNKKEKADYVVLLDHEGGKELVFRDNKIVVFNKEGDSIMSHSTRSLGNAVKDACAVIAQDWPKQLQKAESVPQNQGAASSTASNK